MKEKEFDKIAKNILENPPHFPVDEEARANMLSLLDEKPKGFLLPFWMRYVAALILIPILTFGYTFYRKLNFAHEKINTLEQQLAQFQSTKSDTIFQRQIVYQRDTIIRFIPQNQVLLNPVHSLSENFREFNPGKTLSQLGPGSDLEDASLVYSPGSIQSSESYLKALAEIRAKERLQKTNAWLAYLKKALPDLEGLPFKALDSQTETASILLDDFPMAKLPSDNNRQWHFQPISYALGPKIGFGKHELGLGENEIGFSLGLTALVNFANQLSLTGSIEWLQLHSKIEREEDLGDLPLVAPNSPDDRFSSLDVERKAFNLPIGLQYHFWPRKKIRPFLGAGIVINRSYRDSYKYEFETPDENEYYLELNFEQNNTSANTVFVQSGLLTDVGKKWSLQLEGNYQFRWKTADPYNFLSFRTALFYNF